MTVLWAQERHAWPTAATHMATDDTHGGGDTHGPQQQHAWPQRHARWQRQHTQPQTTCTATDDMHSHRRHTRPVAATCTAAVTRTAADDTHGGSSNTHSLQRRHARPQMTCAAVATTRTAVVDMHGSGSNIVTAPRGHVANKRSSWFLITWATAGKFRRFQAQVEVIAFKAEFPQLRNRCRSKRRR